MRNINDKLNLSVESCKLVRKYFFNYIDSPSLFVSTHEKTDPAMITLIQEVENHLRRDYFCLYKNKTEPNQTFQQYVKKRLSLGCGKRKEGQLKPSQRLFHSLRKPHKGIDAFFNRLFKQNPIYRLPE